MGKVREQRPRKPLERRILKGILYTLFIIFVFVLVAVFSAIGVSAGAMSAMIKDEKIRNKADFQKDLDNLFQTSYAYFQNKDKNGNPTKIGELLEDNNDRKLIKSINDVSPFLTNAFISVEDREFYTHKGVAPRSLLRAAYQQVTHSEVTTGGSTITQQLVKNMILNDREKSLKRKAKEIVLAIRLDSLFDKNVIFVYYMNSVFFGKGAHGKFMYGVASAARGLFNEDVKDLKLAQAAYIAGMVQRPNDYNPFSAGDKKIADKKLNNGITRMKLVLDAMLQNKKITQQQYQEALRFDIKKSLAKPEDLPNSHQKYGFIMHAVEIEAAEALMERDNLKIDELSKQGKFRTTLDEYTSKVSTGGYRFYTTIDKQMYEAINSAATNNLRFHIKSYKGKPDQEQLGAVIIDNRSGALLAFVSSTNKNQIDHALDARNQPGSAIKPLLVYAPAMQEHVLSPDTLILDDVLPKRDGSGVYQNANNKYKGPVSVTEALKWSYNTPAIRAFNVLGFETGFNYLRKLDLAPSPYDGESAAIGGDYNGYTVQKMTAAYATFANNGNYNKPFIISKITDADGNVVWEHKVKPIQVFSPEVAYATTKMLKQVLSGTAAYIAPFVSGYDLAGKTGTSTDYADLWFVGYTPQVTIGAWGGYDYNFTMKYNDKFTKQAWINIFKAAAAASPTYFDKSASFENPGDLGFSTKCIRCDEIDAYNKKKAEEQQKKQQQQQQNGQQPPGVVFPPPDPVIPPDNGNNNHNEKRKGRKIKPPIVFPQP